MPDIEELLKEARSKGASREQLEMLLSAYESPEEKKNLVGNASGTALPRGFPSLGPGGTFSPASENIIPQTSDQGFRQVPTSPTIPVVPQGMIVDDPRSQTGAGAMGQELLRAGARGLTEALPSTLESIAVGAKAVDRALPEGLQSYSGQSTEDLATWRIGRKLRSDLSQVFPRNPALQDSFAVQVAEGLGQVGAMILSRRPIAAGTMGVTQMGSMEYREALDFYKDVKGLEKEEFVKKHAKEGNDAEVGANYNRLRRKKDLNPDEEAFENWLYGSAIGSTEAIPILKFIRNADRISGGTIKKAILKKGIEVGKQGLEEATQEGLSEFFSNLQARQTYDQTRELLQGVGQSAKVGGAVGAILQLMLGINTRRMQTETDPQERAILKANEAQINRAAVEIETKNAEPTEEYVKTEEQVAKLTDDLANPALPQEVKVDIQKEVDRLDKQLEKQEAVTLEDKFDEDLQTSAAEDIAAMEASMLDPAISDETKAIIQKTIDLKKRLISKEKPADAVQKSETEDGLLRPEGPELGLQEVGQPQEQSTGPRDSASQAIPESQAEEKVTPKLFATMGGKSFPVESFQDASEKKDQLEKSFPSEAGRPYGKDAFVQLKDENGNDIGYIDWGGDVWKGTPDDLQTPENLLYRNNKGLRSSVPFTEHSDPSLPKGFQVHERTNDAGTFYEVTERWGGSKTESFKTKQEALDAFAKEYPELVVKTKRLQEPDKPDKVTPVEASTALKVNDKVSFINNLKEPDTGEIMEIKDNGDYVVLKSNGVRNNMTPDKLTKVADVKSENVAGSEQQRLESLRDAEIKETKPDLKLDLVPTKELVASKDPLAAKEKHDAVKERYKKLKQLMDCLHG